MHRYLFLKFFPGGKFCVQRGEQRPGQSEEGIMLQSLFGGNTIYFDLVVQSVYISALFFFLLCVHILMHMCTSLKLSCMFWLFSCPSANLRISYFLLKVNARSLRSSQSCLKCKLCSKSKCFNFFNSSTSIPPCPGKEKKMVALFFRGKDERCFV